LPNNKNNKNKNSSNNNNNNNNNDNYYRKQDPYQNQNAAKNDMRGEFGSTFDFDQLKEQNNNERNNKDLDPGTRNF
jgi:hypothetical protein